MTEDVHAQRTKSELKELAARFISGASNRQSLITVTDLSLSDDSKYATFLVSIFPVEQEATALDFLNRNKDECRAFIKAHSRMRILPYISFKLDEGEKQRQKIDALLQQENK